MSKTDYLENKLLDHVLGVAAYTAPAPHVALFTAAPGEAGGGTEVSGTGYARVAATGKFGAASGGSASNSAKITFPSPGAGGWGNATHWGIFDAAAAGNLLRYEALTIAKTINEGDVVEFDVGALVCSET